MVVYIYESHLGGRFVSVEELSPEDLYCEECGDSDTLINCGDVEQILSSSKWEIKRAIFNYRRMQRLLAKYRDSEVVCNEGG